MCTANGSVAENITIYILEQTRVCVCQSNDHHMLTVTQLIFGTLICVSAMTVKRLDYFFMLSTAVTSSLLLRAILHEKIS
jgi:hypothetical protein